MNTRHTEQEPTLPIVQFFIFFVISLIKLLHAVESWSLIAHFPKKKIPKQTPLFISSLVLIVIMVIDMAVLIHHDDYQAQRKIFISSQTAALGTKNVPSSVKPNQTAVNNYQVAPTLPKYLMIPAINVDAEVSDLSLNSQGQIEAPDNIYTVGWYNGSSLPGQAGAAFMDGHVSSWTADGVFYNLKSLKPGDVIEVVRGDNTVFTYNVVQVQTYDSANVNMNQALSSINPGTPGLNLMTCTGQVIAGTSEFNERLVVYSELQS